jgi:endonuclease/exonuclease/phosphatase family metal-dependent hydrolase
VRLPAGDHVPALALVATVETPDGPLSAVATQFIGSTRHRPEQSQALIDAVTDHDRAVVLGDLNLSPDSEPYELLRSGAEP